MSKTALAVLAFITLALLSIPASAQLIPHGNVYAGVSYAQLTPVVDQQSFRGLNASGELIPFARFPHLGFVADTSFFYRNNRFGTIKYYDFAGGPRLSIQYDKWRPFVHAMAGIDLVNSSGIIYRPLVIDAGGGVDYKLWFKNFSWRVQADFMRSHYANAYQYDYRASTGIVWRF